MPSDSNFPDLPPSPIRDDDQFVVNRDNVSHKINASDLLYYLAGVEFPVDKPCDGDADCPSGQVCLNGYCVERCDPGNCPDGYICVDPDGSGNNKYCVAYPFPCDYLPGASSCPEGYVCIGGLCFQRCDSGEPCPDDTICTTINGIDVCVPYPFPCPEDNICPDGFICYNGYCILECTVSDGCPDGSSCIEVYPGKSACLPYPFPCGSIDHISDKCPPGFYCYAGMCYPICTGDSQCDDGYICTPIGNENNNEGNPDGAPISICIPIEPVEGLINDGKLNIVDDQNNRRVIFSANQYGDTFLKFNGIDIDGENGGGSGSGDLSFTTLWERTDPSQKESDIQPTYENVDALPKGTSSKIGNETTRWDKVYTNNLRSIGTTSDQIQSGTTAQRPTTKPEGGSITSGEVRFNTGRGVERIDQSHHSKDFEVYNGSQWVRMDPKSEGPLYDDNAERRLIYGRGLTTGNSGASPTNNWNDSDIKSWAGYKTYNVPQLEAKLGRGLRFNPTTGAIEYQDNSDDLLIPHTPFIIGRNSQEASEGINFGDVWNHITKTSPTVSLEIPSICNRAIFTYSYKIRISPNKVFYPIKGDVDIPAPPFMTREEFAANRQFVSFENPIGYSLASGQSSGKISGRNATVIYSTDPSAGIIGTDIAASMSYNTVPYEEFISVWATKIEEVSFSGTGSVSFTPSLYIAGINCKVLWNVYRLTVQPYEYQTL